MYKVDSPDAVDFINHQEIIETLEYARAHRNDRELIRNLIEKARLCKGLTHREAAILLECAEEDLTKEIFHLAKEIKQKFYGNRIVMFAPLYFRKPIIRKATKSCIPPGPKATMPIIPRPWTVPCKEESMM